MRLVLRQHEDPPKPGFDQVRQHKKISQKLPPNGTAAFARSAVNGSNR